MNKVYQEHYNEIIDNLARDDRVAHLTFVLKNLCSNPDIPQASLTDTETKYMPHSNTPRQLAQAALRIYKGMIEMSHNSQVQRAISNEQEVPVKIYQPDNYALSIYIRELIALVTGMITYHEETDIQKVLEEMETCMSPDWRSIITNLTYSSNRMVKRGLNRSNRCC